MLKQVRQMGQAHECNFNFEILHTWPNTRKAHGLWMMGETAAQQWALHNALCKAHFSQGLNLNHLSTLVELETRCGLDATEVQRKLSSDDYIRQVETLITHTQNRGISSVPFFVIDQRYPLAGSKGAEEILIQIDRARAEQAQPTN